MSSISPTTRHQFLIMTLDAWPVAISRQHETVSYSEETAAHIGLHLGGVVSVVIFRQGGFDVFIG